MSIFRLSARPGNASPAATVRLPSLTRLPLVMDTLENTSLSSAIAVSAIYGE